MKVNYFKVSYESIVSARCLILRVPEKENSTREYGGVAQMGERLPCKQEVRSSILLISTKRGARVAANRTEMGL